MPDYRSQALSFTGVPALKGLIDCGTGFSVAVTVGGRVLYAGDNSNGQAGCVSCRDCYRVYAGPAYVICQSTGGRISLYGRVGTDSDATLSSEVRFCADVRTVGCGQTHFAIVMFDGRVRCFGDNPDGRCDTRDWTGVIDVVCGKTFTVGLTREGKALFAGRDRQVRDAVCSWDHITGIFTDAAGNHVYGLTRPGEILSSEPLPRQVRDLREVTCLAVSGLKRNKAYLAVFDTGEAQLFTGGGLRRSDRFDSGNICYAVAGRDCLLFLDKLGNAIKKKWAGSSKGAEIGFDGWGPLFDRVSGPECQAGRFAQSMSVERNDTIRRSELSRRYRSTLCCGPAVTACITADATVTSTYPYPDVPDWRQIIALAAGRSQLMGLRADGTVVCNGDTYSDECRTNEWRDVRAIYAGVRQSFGLTKNGDVLFCGSRGPENLGVEDWHAVRLFSHTDNRSVAIGWNGNLLIAAANADDVRKDIESRMSAEDLRHVSRVLLTLGTEVFLSDAGYVRITGRDRSVTERLNRICEKWPQLADVAAADGLILGITRSGIPVSASASVDSNNPARCPFERTAGRYIAVCLCADFAAALDSNGCLTFAGISRGRDGCARFSPDSPAAGVGMNGSVNRDTGGTNLPESLDNCVAMAGGQTHIAAVLENGTVRAFGRDVQGCCGRANGTVLFHRLARNGHVNTALQTQAASGRDGLPVDTGDPSGNSSGDGGFTASYGPRARVFDFHEVCEAFYARSRAIALGIRLSCDGAGRVSAWRDDIPLAPNDVDGTNAPGTDAPAETLPARLTDISGERPVHDIGEPENAFYRSVLCRSEYGEHALTLFSDGTVEPEDGDGTYGDVRNWEGIIGIYAGPGISLGVSVNEKLMSAGPNAKYFRALNDATAVGGTERFAWVACRDGRLYVKDMTDASPLAPVPVSALKRAPSRVDFSLSGSGETARRVSHRVGMGENHTVWIERGLTGGGLVSGYGENTFECLAVRDWLDVTAVGCGLYHTAGIAGGVAVCTGLNRFGQCDADTLNREIDAGATGKSVGNLPPQLFFTDVACGDEHTAVLRNDGRVFCIGNGEGDRCRTEKWRDCLEIACGSAHTVARTASGTCLATGNNDCGQCDVEKWRDIVMVACGQRHTVGLKKDGRLVFCGDASSGQCRLDDLTDICYIACFGNQTVCVHTDGHVTMRGNLQVLSSYAEKIRGVMAVYGRGNRMTVLQRDGRLSEITT